MALFSLKFFFFFLPFSNSVSVGHLPSWNERLGDNIKYGPWNGSNLILDAAGGQW